MAKGAAEPDNEKRDSSDDEEEQVSVGKKRKKPEAEPKEKKGKGIGRKEPMKGRPRSYKIRMLPTKEQEFELKRCFEAARIAYNFANRRVKVDKVPVSRKCLKMDWVREVSELKNSTKGVASRIMNRAITDLVEAYKTNYAKRCKGKGRKFEVKDRDMIKTKTEVIHIEREKMLLGVAKSTTLLMSERRYECCLQFGNNLKTLEPIRIQGRRRIVEKIERNGTYLPFEAKIQWDKSRNAFYFIWVDDVLFKQDPDPLFEDKRICSLDPGVSPIQKFYSPTHGENGELMVNLREEIKRRCLKIDSLCSRLKRRDLKKRPMQYQTKRARGCPNSKKKRRKRGHTKRALRKKMRREQRRLHGMVEAAHYDAANFLLDSYRVIIAPVLNTCRLAKKDEGRIFGSKMARALYTCSHRLFRQRLAFAAHGYPGAYVFECSEPGTSKTCTNCGAWKQDLRLCDKIFHCPRCKISVDRQLAGARNNFLAAYGMAVGVGWDGERG